MKRKKIIKQIKAKLKGKAIRGEFQEEKIPEHMVYFIDSVRSTTLLFVIFWMILTKITLPNLLPVFIIFSFAWMIWRGFYSSYLGWAKLRRLNRVIEKERWNIEHRREQEKKELEVIYKAKGFSGKLLQDVVETIMADDNRLLQVMVEEEMGITLESYEHPVKQSFMSALSVLLSATVLFLGFFLFPFYFGFILAFFLIVTSSFMSYRFERYDLLTSLIWNLAIFSLVLVLTHLLSKLLIPQ